jgi:hypothetical protein
MEALFAIFVLEQSQVDLDLFDLLSMGIGFGFKFPYLARSTGVLGGHDSLKPLDVKTYFRNRVRLSPDPHDEVFINSIGFSYGEKGHYLEFVVVSLLVALGTGARLTSCDATEHVVGSGSLAS